MLKKTLALMLTAVMVLSVTGCSSKGTLYNYDLGKYITLGNYEGLNIQYEEQEVTDEDVDIAISAILSAAGKPQQIKTGKAYNGDTVNIDYSGTVDGKLFEGGTAVNQSLTLGSGNMIPGFEDEIIGHDIGSEFTINVTFPENYHAAELKGKDAEFEIKLNYKEGDLIVPVFDETFVKENSRHTTMSSYLEDLTSHIKTEKEAQELDRVRTKIWTDIVDASEITSYPKKEIDRKVKQNYDYYEQYASNYQMDFKDFLDAYVGMSEEEFEDYINQQAEVVVKQEMVLHAIAKEKNITVSDKEYKEGVLELIKKEGFSSDKEFKEAFGESYETMAGKENIIISLLLVKVMDYLMEENVIYPSKG